MVQGRQVFSNRERFVLPESRNPLLPALLSGSHIVVGSPGSGKTTLLRQLVQEFEKSGHKPEEILVLSPSRQAASRLRDEIALDSNVPATLPRARSIQSFAFAQQQRLNPEVKLFSGSQQHTLLKSLVEAHPNAPWGFRFETVSLDGFIQELRDLITVCLEHELTIEDLKAIAQRHSAGFLAVAIDILPSYQLALSETGFLDPSNLISSAPIDSGFKVIVVDDAQDLSRVALGWISKLSSGKQLILFGDPDASVLGFRSGLTEGFISLFPELHKHFLPPNQKHGKTLGKLASKLPPQLAGSQRPATGDIQEIVTSIFPNQMAEADWVAAQIRKLRIEQGLKFAQIAVVGRTRRQLEQIASQLSARSVPVQIVGAQLALRDQFLSRSMLEVAQLAFSEPTASQIFDCLKSSIIGLDPIGVRRLTRQLAVLFEKESLTRDQALIAALSEEFEPTTPELRRLNKLGSLVKKLRELKTSTAHELVSEIYRAIDSKALISLARGSTEPALSANRDLDSTLELFAAAQRFDQRQLGTASDFVKMQLEQAIPEDSLAPVGLRDAVRLTTASQLLDQSFELVIIPRLQDGIWPNLRPRTSLLQAQSFNAYLAGRVESPIEPVRSELADEIRLMYKAIGSARGKVFLTAIVDDQEQPSQFFEMLKLEPELNEGSIVFDLRRLVGSYRRSLMQGETEFAPRLAALALLGVPGAHPDHWQGLLPMSTSENLTAESEQVRFSPSRLEAFEKCPLHWFVNNFGGDGRGFEASLGTLLHEAMELSQTGAELSEFVESNWHTLEFEAQWQSTAQKRKALNMVAAIDEYIKTAPPLIESEQSFELNIGKLKIVGQIDRVESDGADGIRVVDLKTGKAPTASQAESHRQLAVYQLAMRQLGHKVTGGRIIAVGDQKLRVLEQSGLDSSREQELLSLLGEVAQEAGQNQFRASVSKHCSGDASCQLLITKAVTGA